jgi:hypothetical protein
VSKEEQLQPTAGGTDMIVLHEVDPDELAEVEREAREVGQHKRELQTTVVRDEWSLALATQLH